MYNISSLPKTYNSLVVSRSIRKAGARTEEIQRFSQINFLGKGLSEEYYKRCRI